MARLESIKKLGYYPASPLALRELLKHLKCRAPDPADPHAAINIIDPCCGKGEAIKQIADGLGVDENRVYTIELDRDRTEDVRRLMPKHNHIGPASFLGCQVQAGSFGLAYVNPPFDHTGYGMREEQAFVEKATPLLAHGRGRYGILVLVCPLTALAGNRKFVSYLDANYQDGAVYKFPDGIDPQTGKPIRPFNEIVFIGRKRSTVLPEDAVYGRGPLNRMGFGWRSPTMAYPPPLGGLQPTEWNNGCPGYEREPQVRTWEIPLSWRPTFFKKSQFLDEELEKIVAESPLNKHLRELTPLPPCKPPLPLDRGHLGTCIASGILDGIVEGPYGPHVLRGTSGKVQYHNEEASASTENPETGAVTTKDVWSELPITILRYVDQSGVIYTQSNAPKERGEHDDVEIVEAD